MIRFSKMADYGVLLLGHFTQHEDSLTSAAELAAVYHMPRPVVANLLKSFREAGLLTSQRGQNGGYRLARSPDDISLAEVLGVIDGPVQLIECAVGDIATACDYEDVCPSRSPMRAVNRRIVALLEGISLADLMDETSPVTTTR